MQRTSSLSFGLYFHTIRHLRATQVIGRARFRLLKPAPDHSPAPRVRAPAHWIEPVRRRPSQLGPARFRFLNVERELSGAADWNNRAWEKLWLYNLHYFDDLNAEGAERREHWHRALIERWISENPPAHGNGWEPYTLSLRIVNWIKWALRGNALPQQALQSLAIQARYLAGRLEYHLLGNHLLENAKALAFAGMYFEGEEARTWLAHGMRILDAQIDEQILPDGGHFERSPMYHHIVLEDVLDLVNFMRDGGGDARRAAALERWRHRATAMLGCARALTHPDGDIALLNDAALGVAPDLQALETYAARLGLRVPAPPGRVTVLRDTGYVAFAAGAAWGVLDVGCVGPDYLPGHAHADTLTFELSVEGKRVIVDSGTSTYAKGVERERQRSTGAHNTVEIGGVSSSEVWGGFRVARRAYPFDLEIEEGNGALRVACSHDGYVRLRGRPIHRRTWTVDETAVAIEDTIEGAFDRAVARFRFHPECTATCRTAREGEVRIGASILAWSIDGGEGRLVESSYHPEFGSAVACKCLEVEFGGRTLSTRFTWASPR
jgi:uncharacterized heparinase superfamily protein